MAGNGVMNKALLATSWPMQITLKGYPIPLSGYGRSSSEYSYNAAQVSCGDALFVVFNK
jgi:hypothetical protein